MSNTQLQNLESKVDELIGLCKALKRENQMLKTASASWQQERESLLKKNELAKAGIAATVKNLKAAGRES